MHQTTELNCSVLSCAYNNNLKQKCCLTDILIEGDSAPVADQTRCASFDPKFDSNPVPESCSTTKDAFIACSATLCTFNENEACIAKEITVDSTKDTQSSMQTRCQSFRRL
jgi:hypothetical protein